MLWLYNVNNYYVTLINSELSYSSDDDVCSCSISDSVFVLNDDSSD